MEKQKEIVGSDGFEYLRMDLVEKRVKYWFDKHLDLLDENIKQIQEFKKLKTKTLWYEKTLREIMQKTENDPKLYPHWDREELILDYHLSAKEALDKFKD
jgi:hypothetical protein